MYDGGGGDDETTGDEDGVIMKHWRKLNGLVLKQLRMKSFCFEQPHLQPLIGELQPL